tara:strand:- start:120 stop:743 length:624 start_codon:yes stop_codon:yes gene_type:complete
MVKSKSLVEGIGNVLTTKKYYDDWSDQYDFILNQWHYKVPKKSINLLKKKLKTPPKYTLDLACGTGLFGEELAKVYKKTQLFGSDISKKSLLIAKEKNIYQNLIKKNFESRHRFNIKFDLVSMIGSMTYCKNFDKLFSNVKFALCKKGYFIFSHRIDLWKKQNFDKILLGISKDFKTRFISRPLLYLPLNKDFKNKIKIRLVLLQKY